MLSMPCQAAVRLGDGRGATIRLLRPDDGPAMLGFLTDLSPVGRWRRFHAEIKPESDKLLRRLMSEDSFVYVAMAEAMHPSRQEGPMIAEARYVPLADNRSAELAFVVAENWRRVGLGTRLLRRLMRHARQAGVLALHGETQVDNDPARQFMLALGARQTVLSEHGTIWLQLDL